MKFGVVSFPGSNCEHDMLYALGYILKKDVEPLWHKNNSLNGCDIIILPGGFSYGDYLRSGAIARFSPVMDSIIKHAKAGGVVIGICNGFQILCESGLLPGALLRNSNQKFMCKNVYITPISKNTLITSSMLERQVLKIPIAHAEGRYYAPEETLAELVSNDQIIFKYCDKNGNIDKISNPNGSINNIAGICNRSKNVFGMMPHPERAVDQLLGNSDGILIFESIFSKMLV